MVCHVGVGVWTDTRTSSLTDDVTSMTLISSRRSTLPCYVRDSVIPFPNKIFQILQTDEFKAKCFSFR